MRAGWNHLSVPKLAPSLSSHHFLFDSAERGMAVFVFHPDSYCIAMGEKWRFHFTIENLLDHAHFRKAALAAATFVDWFAGPAIRIAVGNRSRSNN